ncbi:MAG: N-acetyltransferase [Porphyromonadaceae bacterium]|nr:N-acetyltransferase [Porphyromonadaceae bacterium]
MEPITIREVSGRRALKKYVQFNIDLYKGNPYKVPPLILDELNTYSPKTNPALDFCEAVHFMAYEGRKAVGRITGIINRTLNEKTGRKEARFGFVDFVDDVRVSDALFDAVEDWARSKGMNRLVGPMGFTDMDPEGLLVEGYEELGTMATIYNYPYYVDHIVRRGFEPENEWVEFQGTIPPVMTEKHVRIAEFVRKRYHLRSVIKDYHNINDVARDYGHQMFELINEAYKDLYGYSTLTPKQIDYYLKIYIPIVRLEHLSLIVNEENKLVGVGIAMPSLSRALQKAKGRLFPFGFIPLLKALKGKNDIVDLLLVAIHPDYQNKGANALLFDDILPHFIKDGFKYAETNPEMVTNNKVQQQWDAFEHRLHKRRRAYSKNI